jgi:hypothetical protein
MYKVELNSRCAKLNDLRAWPAVKMVNTLKRQLFRDLFTAEQNGPIYTSGMALKRGCKCSGQSIFIQNAKAVAHSGLCEDIAWLGWIGFELLTELPDVHP